MTKAVARTPNVVPGAYRGVALAAVDCDLEQQDLARYFVGREAYRRTRFIVVRKGAETAILSVRKESEDPLFAPITAVQLLVGAADCAYLEDPEADTAVPSALALSARTRAPGKRGVVVQGRYGHVSFILDPSPLRVTVREVVPPHPAKLFDQACRVLDTAEHLPPMELVPDVVDLEELARGTTSASYLLPCRGSGVTVAGATTAFLDERPEHRPWTLIGCERSQQIHEWSYGERAEQVDICPRQRSGGTNVILTKCCLLESHIEAGNGRVVVPWGASLAQISEALMLLAREWEPTWSPV